MDNIRAVVRFAFIIFIMAVFSAFIELYTKIPWFYPFGILVIIFWWQKFIGAIKAVLRLIFKIVY